MASEGIGSGYGKAASDGISTACDFAFMEMMLLSAVSALGSAAIFFAFWPKILHVFVFEAAFAIIVVILAHRGLHGLSSQMEGLSDGMREFSGGDRGFRFADARPGSIEDSMNMWMDATTQAMEVGDDFEAIDEEAARIELLMDAMLNNMVPRDADMLLAVRESASRVRAIVTSREDPAS